MSRAEDDGKPSRLEVAASVLLYLSTEANEGHSQHPGDICEACAAKKNMRDTAAQLVNFAPEPVYCTVSNRESREARLLLRFGSLTLAMKRLESDANAYTHNQQMAEAARAWSKFHAVKAELHDLEPHLAGIRWEDFR